MQVNRASRLGIRHIIVTAALDILDLFELDHPVRLLGVRLELAVPA